MSTSARSTVFTRLALAGLLSAALLVVAAPTATPRSACAMPTAVAATGRTR